MRRLIEIGATLGASFALMCVALALFSSAGCKFKPEYVPPARVSEYQTKKDAVQSTNAALQDAAKEYEAAIESGDEKRIESSRTALEAASESHVVAVESYAAFEDDVVKERVGGFIGWLSSIHPALAAASPLLIPLANVFTPRGSKHALQALKDVPKLLKGNPAVVLDVLKLMGLLHSTPETAAVAKATIGKQQAVTA